MRKKRKLKFQTDPWEKKMAASRQMFCEPMNDFGSFHETESPTGQIWNLGEQIGATGLHEFVLVTECPNCRRRIAQSFDAFEIKQEDFCCGKCACIIGAAPAELIAAGRDAHHRALSEAASIRAAHGGSGLYWPDC